MLPNLPTFSARQDGGVAVLFAFTLFVLMLSAGLAIDYSRAVNAKSDMQAAADAAALAAISFEGSEGAKKNKGKDLFVANMTALGFTVKNPKVTIGSGDATVEADVHVPTTFMKLFNYSTMPVSVRAVAAAGRGAPHDIYLVLDMSASLGIAADAVERQRLKDLTLPILQAAGGFWLADNPNGCAFACHRPSKDIPDASSGFEPHGKTTYQLAKEAGIRLREDVLLEASAAVIDSILDPSSPGVSSGNVRLGVLGFSNTARWLSHPTSDRGTAALSLATFPANERWDTAMDEALPWINEETESESNDRKRSIVLVTDGVRGGMYWDKNWAAIDVARCDEIKNSGAELFVIETKYENESGDLNFDLHVASFFDSISPKLQQCASPGKHFLASSPEQINQAFEAVTQQLGVSKVRLTQ